MSKLLIAVVGIIYTIVATDLYLTGNYKMAVVFFGYAFSNIGLYLAAT